MARGPWVAHACSIVTWVFVRYFYLLVAGQPVCGQHVCGQLVCGQHVCGQPVCGQHVCGQPVCGQHVCGQPVCSQPVCAWKACTSNRLYSDTCEIFLPAGGVVSLCVVSLCMVRNV